MDRVDLLHCPAQTAPPITSCPFVLTVHDLIPLRMDDGLSAEEVVRFRKAFARSVNSAVRIVAVSEFTRHDLLREFPSVEKKVDVVHWGIQPQNGLPDTDEWRSFSDLFGIRRPYFVAFGGDSRRKNVIGILHAFKMFLAEVDRNVQLLLLGVPADAMARVSRVAMTLELNDELIQVGYAPESLLPALLGDSEAVIYASMYEGFGLPILEAMAAGAPIITSSLTSMPEVAGNAALFVDPEDPASIKEAMRTIYLNEPVKFQMRELGAQRLKAFTWERAAESTVAVYRQALAEA